MLINALKGKRNSIPLTCLILLTACGKSSLGPDAYLRWVEDEKNGCLQTKEIGDAEVRAMFKPLPYVTLKSWPKNLPLTHASFDSLQQLYKGMEYYTIMLRAKEHQGDPLLYNLNDQAEYYKRIQYYTAEVKNNISLVKGNDTLPCSLFHFERTYGVSPYNNLLLGFTTNDAANTAPGKLIYNDEVLNTGMLIFSFESNHIPNLKPE